ARGHTADLFFIIPAGAPLAPTTRLTSEKVREGKIPGLPTVDGWVGLVDRNSYYCTAEQLAEWVAMARHIGGPAPPIGFNAREIPRFDCDTEDPRLAKVVLRSMDALFTLGIRGRTGSFHWLAPLKLATPIHHLQMNVWPAGVSNGPKDRARRLALIEIIAIGQ